MNDGIKLQGVSFAYRPGTPILDRIAFEAPRGCITALLGPNGAGKSTLIRAIAGLVEYEGEIRLDGEDLHMWSRRERAQRIAYVPQRSQLSARLSVRSVVQMGRFAHRAPLERLQASDHDAVQQALVDVGAQKLAHRFFSELSGGEQQRVLLARALATGATALLLDEPTASLDVRQVLGLHRVLSTLRDKNYCICMVLHDLSEAREHADRAVLLREGRLQCQGVVDEIIAGPPVREVYEVHLREREGLAYRLPTDAFLDYGEKA